MARRDRDRGESELTIYGRHAVFAALESDGAEVRAVTVAKGAAADDRARLARLADRAKIEFEECTREALTRRTGAPRHDQGIAARVRLLRVTTVESWLDRAKGAAAREPQRLLALDGVTNAQNVGMVVRSVVAAGLDGLVWPVVGQPWVGGLVVRAAVGAIFECSILRCESLLEGLVTLQSQGFRVFGLDAAADRSLFEIEPAHRAVFVLGSESAGLSATVRGVIDEPVSIPMMGAVESLNVAVAAGLVAYRAAGLLGRGSEGRGVRSG